MNSLYSIDEIEKMSPEQKEAHLLANVGRSFGLMESSALHDPANANVYRARFEDQVEKLRADWNKLSDAAQDAVEFAISETSYGFDQAEVVNAIADILGPPVEL